MSSSVRRGDVCANGALIIDYKKAWDPDGFVVLCLWLMDKQVPEPYERKADPYVTWTARRSAEGDIITQNGHYFDRLSDAVVDFNNRI
jgi:hypothetical protein